jgi:hypothetical protein
MSFHAGVLLRKTVLEMTLLGRLRGLVFRVILLQTPGPGTCGLRVCHAPMPLRLSLP